MFSYTKKEIVILAEKINVQKQTLERVLRLIDILEFINEDEYLKGKLVLKHNKNAIFLHLPKQNIIDQLTKLISNIKITIT